MLGEAEDGHVKGGDSAVRDRGGTLGDGSLRHRLAIDEIAEAYDQFADSYDTEYSTVEDIEEDNDVFRRLGELPITPPIVDLGCGTGKFLEMFPRYERQTVGYDVSERMVQHAREKFDRATFVCEDMYEATGEFMTVVSLFGSPSYTSWSDFTALVWRLLHPGGRCLLMPLDRDRVLSPREIPAAHLARFIDEEEAGTRMFLRGFGNVRTEVLNNKFIVASGRKYHR